MVRLRERVRDRLDCRVGLAKPTGLRWAKAHPTVDPLLHGGLRRRPAGPDRALPSGRGDVLPGARRGGRLRPPGREDPGRFHDALSAYDQAIAADPDNPEARVALGELFLAKYNSRDARAIFELALERDPDMPGRSSGSPGYGASMALPTSSSSPRKSWSVTPARFPRVCSRRASTWTWRTTLRSTVRPGKPSKAIPRRLGPTPCSPPRP